MLVTQENQFTSTDQYIQSQHFLLIIEKSSKQLQLFQISEINKIWCSLFHIQCTH